MQVLELICFNCKHYREFRGGCDAFPDGIPEEVIEKNKHNKPLPKQENNLVYTPIERNNNIFKIYSKFGESNECDSVFSIIGRNETDLTKSLAFLLYYSNKLLKRLLIFIDPSIDLNYERAIISAEQKPNILLDKRRRDISIILYYENEPFKNTLIVIEAKNLFLKDNSGQIRDQLLSYFDGVYSDTNSVSNKIGVTLTNEKLYLSESKDARLDKIFSITWQDIIYILSDSKDYFIESFKKEIMNSNFIKTYEEEVFCPPVGDSFAKVEELSIYCCPADRSLKEAVYLLPRIPINKIENILTEKYGITNFSNLKGKGCSIALYKIEKSFIVDHDSIDAIENHELREKVKKWIGTDKVRLKVFVLSEKMEFERPKITEVQNNNWNGYFKLSQVWGDIISKKSRL